MMQHMRQQAKAYFIVVTAAFLLFGFIMWGRGSSGGGNAPANVIGKVNGEAISITEYRAATARAYNDYRQRGGGEMDDATRTAIDDQTWQTLVRDKLLAQMVKKYKITVSDAEIVQAVKTNPPQDVAQMPQFQTNGQFDPAKYRAALANPNVDWSPVEEEVRQQLPVQKLQMRLLAGVTVSDAEVKQAFIDQAEKADLMVAAASAAGFPADSSNIGESDMKKFYDGHHALFTTDEQAKLFVVQIPTIPSPADQAQAMETAKAALDELKTRDFAEVAKSMSEGPWASNGGASPQPMPANVVSPQIKSALDALQPGAVSAPVMDQAGIHILKFGSKGAVTSNGLPGYQYSEILIKVRPGDETLRKAKERVDQLIEAAKKSGLQQAATEMKLMAGATPYFSKDRPLQGLDSGGIIDYAFSAKIGTVSDAINRPNAWLVVSVLDRRKAGLQPMDAVRPELRQMVVQQRRMDAAKARIEQIAKAVAGGQTLAAAAAAAGIPVQAAPGMSRVQALPGIGEAPALLGAAFATPAGGVTKPQELPSGWAIAQVVSKTPADMTLFATQKEQLRQQLMGNRQQMMLNRWFQDIYKAAKIVDYRAKAGYEG